MPNTRGSFYFAFSLFVRCSANRLCHIPLTRISLWTPRLSVGGSWNEQNPCSVSIWSSITDSNCHGQFGRLKCYHYINTAYVWSARWDSNPHGCPPDPKSGAYANFATYGYMVPATGLEPVRGCPQRILSPLRLPIPPRRDLLEREAQTIWLRPSARAFVLWLSFDYIYIISYFFYKIKFLAGGRWCILKSRIHFLSCPVQDF